MDNRSEIVFDECKKWLEKIEDEYSGDEELELCRNAPIWIKVLVENIESFLKCEEVWEETTRELLKTTEELKNLRADGGIRMHLKRAEEFNKEAKEAIDNETYEDFLYKHGFADAWEVLEHILKLLYGGGKNECKD